LRLGPARDEGSIPFTRFRPLVPRGLQRGRPRWVAATINQTYSKGESVAPQGRVSRSEPHQATLPCPTSTFSNPLLCPVISISARPTICGSACANIRATSILTRRSTALGSSKPTWHSNPYLSLVATYGFTIFAGSTTRSNSASVTKPSFKAAAFNVRSLSVA
jgi:hypothetical protein